MNPFKWFNDLIERSALWYAVYIIVLRIICGNFFTPYLTKHFMLLLLYFSVFLIIWPAN